MLGRLRGEGKLEGKVVAVMDSEIAVETAQEQGRQVAAAAGESKLRNSPAH